MVYFSNNKNGRELSSKAKKNILIKVCNGVYVNNPIDIYRGIENIIKYLDIKGIVFYRSALEFSQKRFSNNTIFIISKTVNKKISLYNGYFNIEVLKTKSFDKWKKFSECNDFNKNIMIPNEYLSMLINFVPSSVFSKRANIDLAFDILMKNIVDRYQSMQFKQQLLIVYQVKSEVFELSSAYEEMCEKFNKFLEEEHGRFDEERVSAFKRLASTLLSIVPLNYEHIDDKQFFYEAYFSNYIEGTEFEVKEARDIVYDPSYKYTRHQDGHDIKETYKLIENMHKEPLEYSSFEDFIIKLKRTHRELMYHRREHIRVGEFKTKVNKSGEMYFVLPNRVNETLREAYKLYEDLDTHIAKGIFLHTVISEIHPFDDGNGRLARLFMNNELSRGGYMRIIIPTVFREDYISALKGFSYQSNPTPIVRAILKALKITHEINWEDNHALIEEYISDNSGFEKDAIALWGTKPRKIKKEGDAN